MHRLSGLSSDDEGDMQPRQSALGPGGPPPAPPLPPWPAPPPPTQSTGACDVSILMHNSHVCMRGSKLE
jgi:hypothetical protein